MTIHWPDRIWKAITPRGLFARSLLIIGVPVVMLQLVVAVVFLDRHWEAVTARLAEAVAREIQLVVTVMPDRPTGQWLAEAGEATQMQFEWQPGHHWHETPDGQQNIFSRMIGRAVKDNLPYPARVQLDQQPKMYDIIVKLDDGILRVRVPERRLYTASTFSFILWFSATALIMLTVAILFMRNQVRPIVRLAQAAGRFGRGLDTPNFKPEGAREVRRAAEAFLRMRDRLQRQITQRTEMLAGVSHDLRSPLTRMQLQLALMGEQGGVADLRTDIQEMTRMIDAYLAFARGEGDEEASEISLRDLISSIQADLARQGSAAIEVVNAADIRLTARAQALRRALFNLMHNASRYAAHVQIRLATGQDAYGQPQAEITLDDNGPGIPASQREDVFRPFYRVDAAGEGSLGGLGMTIARDIIRSHGGDILLADSPARGLSVQISLPLV